VASTASVAYDPFLPFDDDFCCDAQHVSLNDVADVYFATVIAFAINEAQQCCKPECRAVSPPYPRRAAPVGQRHLQCCRAATLGQNTAQAV
jgi:hypothetical protein